MANCLFCRIADHQEPVEGRGENVILCESDSFYVKPALGHFIEGYCLVVTKEHARTMAELTREECFELANVLDEVGGRLNTLYPNGRCVFEHGAVCPANRAGSCIDHAHMHVLPINCDVRGHLSALSGDRIGSVRELTSFGSHLESYIYYEPEPGLSMVYSCHDRVPSQFMRRLIGQQLGGDKDWDWRVSPHSEKIQQFTAKWWASFPIRDLRTNNLCEVKTTQRVL